jgi:hypothetical protein
MVAPSGRNKSPIILIRLPCYDIAFKIPEALKKTITKPAATIIVALGEVAHGIGVFLSPIDIAPTNVTIRRYGKYTRQFSS